MTFSMYTCCIHGGNEYAVTDSKKQHLWSLGGFTGCSPFPRGFSGYVL